MSASTLPRSRHRAVGWRLVAAVLAALSVIVAIAAPHLPGVGASLDWQPSLDLAQPWRPWTAAVVHGSVAHLLGNLVATLLVAALGVRAGVGAREAVAWSIAWPLTHVGLDLVEATTAGRLAAALPHYGGASGVLHAGVAIVVLALLGTGRSRRERWVGAALGAGLVVKLAVEAPWRLATAHDAMLGIDVAPIGHATGVAAGLVATGLAEVVGRRRRGGAGERGHARPDRREG